ncbi:hypothetical protein EHI8A_004730 [Entamoeba histolytica HM-1:IMSS-B]|uniref:Uncharacterized protein n=5 Tax=Entamoeba histolytica TaxID=5759 RepID=C4M3L1_ENTH1|nr:hypothetical protein EHI_109920 [Entamoeba histolytica HM-1:IMSS]EMD42524.1 Hypothetical protein EHI5A_019270 [Entamoeba histolytica KU27]EMH73821.1 hypothetical protein EHI8A_004730 [Entamoeba histolytica HM-1:IMSS-B]ENY60323.1 hypothetical protein EHI7A_020360 [Entamoeba histolytica HM-1:IMSS-A]GAT95911.1 hypothetical protein CL6EHI_109920 [Entamoeba histolytica]EAL46816.1 hypothetical protein EHI_109920 [Entamoeba histolytica HM-1:IMSS]|eukprot:XP_652202.1 hypothetical protein EHI_109920 [Entamoeba histolytica HM-1:IMSS]
MLNIIFFLTLLFSVVKADLFSFDEFDLIEELSFGSHLYDSFEEEQDDEALDAFMTLFETNDFLLSDTLKGKQWRNARVKVANKIDKTKMRVIKKAQNAAANVKGALTDVLEESTLWMAKNGDAVAEVLEKVENVAGVASKTAGVVGFVATAVSPVFPPAAGVAGAALAVSQVAKGIEYGAKGLGVLTKTATQFSKGYQVTEGTTKERLKAGAKEGARQLLKDGISIGTEHLTDALSDAVTGTLAETISGAVGAKLDESSSLSKLAQATKDTVSEKVGELATSPITTGIEKGTGKLEGAAHVFVDKVFGENKNVTDYDVHSVREMMSSGKTGRALLKGYDKFKNSGVGKALSKLKKGASKVESKIDSAKDKVKDVSGYNKLKKKVNGAVDKHLSPKLDKAATKLIEKMKKSKTTASGSNAGSATNNVTNPGSSTGGSTNTSSSVSTSSQRRNSVRRPTLTRTRSTSNGFATKNSRSSMRSSLSSRQRSLSVRTSRNTP